MSFLVHVFHCMSFPFFESSMSVMRVHCTKVAPVLSTLRKCQIYGNQMSEISLFSDKTFASEVLIQKPIFLTLLEKSKKYIIFFFVLREFKYI